MPIAFYIGPSEGKNQEGRHHRNHKLQGHPEADQQHGYEWNGERVRPAPQNRGQVVLGWIQPGTSSQTIFWRNHVLFSIRHDTFIAEWPPVRIHNAEDDEETNLHTPMQTNEIQRAQEHRTKTDHPEQ